MNLYLLISNHLKEMEFYLAYIIDWKALQIRNHVGEFLSSL